MDERTALEKIAWDLVGEPLYYCKECLRAVDVKEVDGQIIVKRLCSHEGEIIAPRKSILSGKGYAGLSLMNKARVKYQQIGATITGRNV